MVGRDGMVGWDGMGWIDLLVCVRACACGWIAARIASKSVLHPVARLGVAGFHARGVMHNTQYVKLRAGLRSVCVYAMVLPLGGGGG